MNKELKAGQKSMLVWVLIFVPLFSFYSAGVVSSFGAVYSCGIHSSPVSVLNITMSFSGLLLPMLILRGVIDQSYLSCA